MSLHHSTLAIVILLSSFCPTSSASIHDDQSGKQSQISYGYWNDNFLFEDEYENKSFHGKDDYVTMSLWLQVAFKKNSTWWLVDCYHNTLTNKTKPYRTDLLTVRLSAERNSHWGTIQAGTGIIANGNFGGSKIQNGYHRIAGHDRVSLPYATSEKAGIIAFFRNAHLLINRNRIKLTAYLSNSHRFRVGPSALKVGDELTMTWQKNGGQVVFRTQIHTGYMLFYSQGRHLFPLFDRGFTWGILGSLGIVGKHNIALWVTRNQYGLHQPHFGISYSYSGNESRMMNITDISFP